MPFGPGQPRQDGHAPLRRPDTAADLFLTLQRAADRLMQGLEEALRPMGFTPVQYLVLRSLRQAGSAGMPINQIVREMTTHDPDMTRLLDKLEERGAVQRWREPNDRRVIRVKLTRDGVRLLKELSGVVRALHRRQLRPLTARQAETLLDLLQAVNEAPIPTVTPPARSSRTRASTGWVFAATGLLGWLTLVG